MKNLTSIIRAIHGIDEETSASHRTYIAEGVSDKKQIKGEVFIHLKWRSSNDDAFITTIEQESLLSRHREIFNHKPKASCSIDDDLQVERKHHKILAISRGNYYIFAFFSSYKKYNRFRSFLMANFQIFMELAKLNQYDSTKKIRFEGSEQQKFNLKIKITLINRYDSKLTPFLTPKEKEEALKKETVKVEEKIEEEVEEEKERRKAKEQRMEIEDLSEKCLQRLAQENRMEMIRYEAQEKMMIQLFTNPLEAPLLNLEHRIPDFLIDEKAIASRIEDIEPEREKVLGDSEMQAEPIKKQDERKEPSLGSFSPLSIDLQESKQPIRAPIRIVSYTVKIDGKRVFKIQKDGATSCFTLQQMNQLGYDVQARKFMKMRAAMATFKRDCDIKDGL